MKRSESDERATEGMEEKEEDSRAKTSFNALRDGLKGLCARTTVPHTGAEGNHL